MPNEKADWRRRNRTEEAASQELSAVQKSSVLGIFLSDVHARHDPPTARSAEMNWYYAMERQFKQVTDLAKKHFAFVAIAGDLFHSWKASAQVINFLVDQLPRGTYAIPGQHDLPHHSYSDLDKTPYWTLVKAGVLRHVDPYTRVKVKFPVDRPDCPTVFLHGFPWGFKITPNKENYEGEIHIALVHSYVWTKDYKYDKAPEDKNIVAYLRSLKGYDCAFFGDNHIGFKAGKVINGGAFFRNRTDERGYQPRVGLLQKDGTMELHDLDVSQDVFVPEDSPAAILDELHLGDVLEEFRKTSDDVLDFVEIVKHWLNDNNAGEPLRRLVLKCMEEGK